MLKCFFDGACEPNRDFGKMSYGGVIYQDDKIIHEISYIHKRPDNIASNNIAEYCGFIAICRYLLANNLTKQLIDIFGDSKLVVEQMNGNWEIKKGKYTEYAIRATNLIQDFHKFPGISWIPKEENTIADKLSRSV